MDPTDTPPSHSGSSSTLATAATRKVRGKAKCIEIHKMPAGKKKKVKVNERAQPVGKNAQLLAGYLGNIARDAHLLRIDVRNWRAMSDADKTRGLEVAREKFDFPPIAEDFVLKSLGKKWKDSRSSMGRKLFDLDAPPAVNYERCPSDIPPEQWHTYVDYLYTDEAKKRKAVGKVSRESQEIPHTAGSKSFARVREEERLASPSGIAPGRAEVWIKTHTKKDGLPVNSQAGETINKLKDVLSQLPVGSQDSTGRNDVLSQVMGPERDGRIRGCGLGPTPTRLWGSSSRHSDTIGSSSGETQMLRDELEATKSQVETQKAQMEAQAAKIEAQQSQMEAQQTQLNEMQRMFNQFLQGQQVAGQGTPAPHASLEEGAGSTHLSSFRGARGNQQDEDS